MNAIEIINLTKSYGKNRGIENIDLTVEEGDFFGFIGPNGAGKSTTIRTLLGLISKTDGSAKIFGEEVGPGKKEILSKIGYLPSETDFYQGMRVKDVLKFSAELHKKNCDTEARYLCEKLDLDVSRKVDELSLGNRKKVGIVCALQHKPSLYIMDEPTSGLDPLMQKAFYELMNERNKEGATVFLSSHVLSEIQNNCRHAAVIREGKILACDTVENLGTGGAKKIILSGIESVPQISGIKGIKALDDGVLFYYSGDMQKLLKTLSLLSFKDITISEPDLNEIFLHYYETEGEK